jgi:hypothetical protein
MSRRTHIHFSRAWYFSIAVTGMLWLPAARAADSSMAGQFLHVFTWVKGYSEGGPADICSVPGTQMYVVSDDSASGSLTVSIHKLGATPTDAGPTCTNRVVAGHVYTINKKFLTATDYTSQGLVGGVLAVPFKFHIAGKTTTSGSTIGGYVGYRTNFSNWFTITPIVAGGLALISAQPAQASSGGSPGAAAPNTGSQTSSGFSIATGLIGSVSNTGSGSQFGILIGLDWLGKGANYQYEGKPWIAFEIGYNFSQ